jgi:hypothetical protein
MGQLRRMATVCVPLALAVSLAACGSGPKAGAKHGAKHGAKSTTTTVPVTTTTLAPQVKSTLTQAVTSYETAQGVTQSEYTVDRLQTSSVDPTWALFSLLAAKGETDFQNGYGFAHMTSGSWSVVGFGSSMVGCPPGAAGNQVVPAKVLAGFFLSCSTPAST